MERVLRHKHDDLIGANLSDILVPASKEALQHLIEELVAAERAAALGDSPTGEGAEGVGASGLIAKKPVQENNANGDASGRSSSGSAGEVSSGGAAVVSDQSFPLAVVKVQNRRQQNSSAADSSDMSTSNGGKSAPSKDSAEPSQAKNDVSSPSASKRQPQASSDDSLSSSSDIKNLRKANEALNRNVRWHNEKLLGSSKAGSSSDAHKDDVTGAFVTANNADARLSSLQHHPRAELSLKRAKSCRYESLEEQSTSSSSVSLLAGVEEKKKGSSKNDVENASEDSGYRESNDSQSSPEDSATDSSSGKFVE